MTIPGFCPVHCKMDEMTCGGQWDPKTGKQMTADTCMPMKNDDCANSCPVYCNEGDMMCSGGKLMILIISEESTYL